MVYGHLRFSVRRGFSEINVVYEVWIRGLRCSFRALWMDRLLDLMRVLGEVFYLKHRRKAFFFKEFLLQCLNTLKIGMLD